MKYNTYFNGIYNEDIGIRATDKPSIQYPEEEVEEKQIDGRAEPLTIKKEIRGNLTIEIPYCFSVTDYDDYYPTTRIIKKHFQKITDNKLILEDDNVFYKVKYCRLSKIERHNYSGAFTVQYICSPYAYFESGKYEIKIENNSTLNNEYDISYPIYKIVGEGLITLTVNNKDFQINVGQSVTIDTELKECIKNNEQIKLALRTGDYEDLWLKEGLNTFSYSVNSGSISSISIIPNYRE